ncbi:CdaR family transcriptional regulator [Nocardioides sp. CFH 31398]|uniref:PucR family transcriptional regulator n=1 Tax=Nocardioides sp. CFH 31398 TaxID=2919579 RepID=UPI001F0623EE|nr:PucR family transcriptional regulator [Nocardioides sp. CFH 31398]MCH1864934.1 helix-turn-helix domain-containing protein [Nocardioides sp. CFH 31398]
MSDSPTLPTPDLVLPAEVLAQMRGRLPQVAERTVDAIISEVPSYAGALSGPMGEKIRQAVQLALGGFISLASRAREAPRTPTAPAVDGAYQLGRGEARAGRSMEALLAAYRIGARASWREMSAAALAGGIGAEELGDFAGLVFAYIDELSASSAAGHTDELTTSGRVRRRRLEQLAGLLLTGAPRERVVNAAEQVEWALPDTLTALVVPDSQRRAVLGVVSPATLQPAEDLPGLEGRALLLVPDVAGARRATLVAALEGRDAVLGPSRPTLEVRASWDRAARALGLGLGEGVVDTEEHLCDLVLHADPVALGDLRARALAPLADVRGDTAEKLQDTLRSWLLHQGRRDAVAADLFCHPQTVRYRMGRLRELYGDALDDPRTVLELTLALA